MPALIDAGKLSRVVSVSTSKRSNWGVPGIWTPAEKSLLGVFSYFNARGTAATSLGHRIEENDYAMKPVKHVKCPGKTTLIALRVD
jgi:hypothetical protein